MAGLQQPRGLSRGLSGSVGLFRNERFPLRAPCSPAPEPVVTPAGSFLPAVPPPARDHRPRDDERDGSLPFLVGRRRSPPFFRWRQQITARLPARAIAGALRAVSDEGIGLAGLSVCPAGGPDRLSELSLVPGRPDTRQDEERHISTISRLFSGMGFAYRVSPVVYSFPRVHGVPGQFAAIAESLARYHIEKAYVGEFETTFVELGNFAGALEDPNLVFSCETPAPR